MVQLNLGSQGGTHALVLQKTTDKLKMPEANCAF